MNIRKQTFWLLDRLKGGPVRKHLKEIAAMYDAKSLNEKIDQTHRRLTKILQHAQSTTDYYKQFAHEEGLSAFPIINKNIVRENYSAFLSDKYDETNRFAAITSGSTGTPFKVYHNKDKKNRNSADTIFFASLAGFEVGEKLFYFKIWSKYSRKNAFLLFLQNMVPVDVVNLSRNSSAVVSKINKLTKPIHFLGFVSAYETLFHAIEGNKMLSPNVKAKSIIAIAETLNDYTRIKGEEIFKCPVLSRYSNIENGIIAQQTLESRSDFIINVASYFVEILAFDRDEAVANGEPGRIVITDLYNEAMPLIRYDTGDVGIMKEKDMNGTKRLVLSKVEGRKLDQIYNTKGELISSFVVYQNMWNYTELDQYQLIQTGPKDYVMKICVSEGFKREDELVSDFVRYLGFDANFKIERVNEIPLLSSGKRKKVVNLMKPTNTM